jgi:hypothetical protein
MSLNRQLTRLATRVVPLMPPAPAPRSRRLIVRRDMSPACVGYLTLLIKPNRVDRVIAHRDLEVDPTPSALSRLRGELLAEQENEMKGMHSCANMDRATARALVGALCLFRRLRREGDTRALRLLIFSPYWVAVFRRNLNLWRKRGWRTRTGDTVQDADLLQKMDLLRRGLPITAILHQ